MRDYKTTTGGILSAIIGGLVYTNKIDQNTGISLLGLVGLIIGYFSKDKASVKNSDIIASGFIEENTDPQNPKYPPKK
jgi:hypothetical protein